MIGLTITQRPMAHECGSWWRQGGLAGSRAAGGSEAGVSCRLGERPMAPAERLTAAGFATLCFDHRNFGASGGEPREHEDTSGKLYDLRDAVSYLAARPEVDPGRIGCCGICLGGGGWRSGNGRLVCAACGTLDLGEGGHDSRPDTTPRRAWFMAWPRSYRDRRSGSAGQ
jgi:fermentation-respiration switch protein FrsA (DUF1100 family)